MSLVAATSSNGYSRSESVSCILGPVIPKLRALPVRRPGQARAGAERQDMS